MRFDRVRDSASLRRPMGCRTMNSALRSACCRSLRVTRLSPHDPPSASLDCQDAALMLAKLATYSLYGIEARPVDVEVDISPGAMPKTILVGLAEAAVRESTHRIERALVNSGYTRPMDRIVINLSPRDIPKEPSSF